MSEEIRHGDRASEIEHSQEHSPGGRRFHSMLWTLLAALAVIAVVLLLLGRFHNNATSTVNPQKSSQ